MKMTKPEAEETLIEMLKLPYLNKNVKSIILQAHISEYGPVSDKNGDIIRELVSSQTYPNHGVI